MTYSEICKAFYDAGIDSSEWDAQLLIGHFCGASSLEILGEPNREWSEPSLEQAVERRRRREPLQYLLGTWEFYRQTYEVSPACLVPRSDTEILVEEAIKRLPQGAFFADLCTGSGCIAISVLAERKDTRSLAVELSEEALDLAKRNAERNGVAHRFCGVWGDVLADAPAFAEAFPKPHAIFSNPPYIPTEVLETLGPEVRQEPRMALDGGEDGLIFYRKLLRLAERWLQPNGFCLFEIGYDQGEALVALAAQHGFSCAVRKDFGGCDRVAICTPLTSNA